jgi:alpha-beta hydrolase superfamily lysophospholipase
VALAVDSPTVAGRRALDYLLSANYSGFSSLLTPTAKEKLTPEFLKDHVGVEVKGFGKPGEVGKPLLAASGPYTLVSFPVKFSLVTINVQFTIDGVGHVAGLYFRPADSPLPPEWQRPNYSKPNTFHETDVTVGSDEWQLPGTLTVPNGKGPFTAVLLVNGPGPNDRDETIYSNHMFKDLAEGLASRGFAVLRYDKRSHVYGQRMSGSSYTLQQDTVEDAVRALALLRKQPNVNAKRVFVVAHSLGGYALPRIAKQDGKLAGAVVLAGNARPIEDVVLDQAAYTTQAKVNVTPEDLHRFDALKAEIEKVKKLQPGAGNPPAVMGLPVAYLLDLKTYNPVAEMKGTTMPVMYLQGERDFQVTMKDFEIWKSGLAGRKATTFHSYPALNHLFMAGEGKPLPTDYRVPSNVSVQIVDEIAKWIVVQ